MQSRETECLGYGSKIVVPVGLSWSSVNWGESSISYTDQEELEPRREPNTSNVKIKEDLFWRRKEDMGLELG